jgi:serine phosphatase RsbU (regulator of sigma subunit)
MVRKNPQLLGAAVAFVPDYHPELGKLYAPYVYRQYDDIKVQVLNYDYTQFDWYLNAAKKGKRDWCDPYVDQDGTYALMSTYSLTLHDQQGRVAAVLTGDLPMSELSYVTGEIYHKSSMRSIAVLAMQFLAILFILFIGWRAYKNMKKMEEADKEKEDVSEELNIASRLQAVILPQVYPKHERLSMAGSIVPAPQVSGDFYDFTLQDNKLFFCIGDVSTHGLGATLAMLVTRTVYRTSINSQESLALIMGKMNRALTELNEPHMFAMLFMGRLDLATGSLSYCNAGHLPPYRLSGGVATPLDVRANVPLGIRDWEYESQHVLLHPGDTLFLYTAGIVERVNGEEKAFGEKRLALHLKNASEYGDEPKAVLQRVKTALDNYVGDNGALVDDLTMLAVGYLPPSRQ